MKCLFLPKMTIAAFALFIGFHLPIGIAGIDSEIIPKITVGSEINRGFLAISQYDLREDVKVASEKTYARVIHENTQRNTATPAFKMGASVAMLLIYKMLKEGNVIDVSGRHEDIEDHIHTVVTYWRIYSLSEEEISAECGISTVKFQSLFGLTEAKN